MAKPRISKKKSKKRPAKGSYKWPGEKGSGRHSISWEEHRGRMPFRVLDSPYRTNAEFDDAVSRMASGQVQPRLDDLTRRESTASRSHTGRINDITRFYDASSTARQNAITKTSEALNNLISLNSGLSGATQSAMAAALRAGQDREAAVKSQLGLASDPNSGQAYLDATQANTDVSGIGITGEFANILGGLGREVGINEIGRQEARNQEVARNRGVTEDLETERTQLNDELPNLREAARQNLLTSELTRSSTAEQQRIGRAQQGLAERQFGETEKMGRSQRSIARAQQREAERSGRTERSLGRAQQRETERSNRANESINERQVQAQILQMESEARNAGDTATADKLKAKAKRFKNGTDLIASFAKPTKGETGKSGKARKTYEQRMIHSYDEMVQQLQSATGAGPIEVRQMILAAVNASSPWGQRWVRRANQEIRSFRNARIYKDRVRG